MYRVIKQTFLLNSKFKINSNHQNYTMFSLNQSLKQNSNQTPI